MSGSDRMVSRATSNSSGGSSRASSSGESTTVKVAWAGVCSHAWSGDQSPSQPRQPVDHLRLRSAFGPVGMWSSEREWWTAKRPLLVRNRE